MICLEELLKVSEAGFDAVGFIKAALFLFGSETIFMILLATGGKRKSTPGTVQHVLLSILGPSV
jgi:hypothetical protein